MKRFVTGCLVLVIAGATAGEVFALGSDFSKDELAAAGKHCVHGFWVNERNVTFYAGDAAQLNRDLSTYREGSFASRQVVLHVGPKQAKSPWDMKPRETFADWSVDTLDDPADAALATPRMRIRVDVWLGRAVRLEDLRIPAEFEVVSGGEVEAFLQAQMQKAK